jgi:hypothetical protein
MGKDKVTGVGTESENQTRPQGPKALKILWNSSVQATEVQSADGNHFFSSQVTT